MESLTERNSLFCTPVETQGRSFYVIPKFSFALKEPFTDISSCSVLFQLGEFYPDRVTFTYTLSLFFPLLFFTLKLFSSRANKAGVFE